MNMNNSELCERFAEAIRGDEIPITVTKGWRYRKAWTINLAAIGYKQGHWLPQILGNATGIRDNHTTFELVWEGRTLYVTLHDWSILVGTTLTGDMAVTPPVPDWEPETEMQQERGVTDVSLANGRVLKAKYGRVRNVLLIHRGTNYHTNVVYQNDMVHTFTGFSWGYSGNGCHGLVAWAKDNGLGKFITLDLVEVLNNKIDGVALDLRLE